MVIAVDEDVDPFNLPGDGRCRRKNPAGDLVQLPNMSVLELIRLKPGGDTDKLIIDATTTPVAPDNRGHFIASRLLIYRKLKPTKS